MMMGGGWVEQTENEVLNQDECFESTNRFDWEFEFCELIEEEAGVGVAFVSCIVDEMFFYIFLT
ncbi:hypothetical protein Hanom_Chr09g00861461 [Helianthus anomalus]